MTQDPSARPVRLPLPSASMRLRPATSVRRRHCLHSRHRPAPTLGPPLRPLTSYVRQHCTTSSPRPHPAAVFDPLPALQHHFTSTRVTCTPLTPSLPNLSRISAHPHLPHHPPPHRRHAHRTKRICSVAPSIAPSIAPTAASRARHPPPPPAPHPHGNAPPSRARTPHPVRRRLQMALHAGVSGAGAVCKPYVAATRMVRRRGRGALVRCRAVVWSKDELDTLDKLARCPRDQLPSDVIDELIAPCARLSFVSKSRFPPGSPLAVIDAAEKELADDEVLCAKRQRSEQAALDTHAFQQFNYRVNGSAPHGPDPSSDDERCEHTSTAHNSSMSADAHVYQRMTPLSSPRTQAAQMPHAPAISSISSTLIDLTL